MPLKSLKDKILGTNQNMLTQPLSGTNRIICIMPVDHLRCIIVSVPVKSQRPMPQVHTTVPVSLFILSNPLFKARSVIIRGFRRETRTNLCLA